MKSIWMIALILLSLPVQAQEAAPAGKPSKIVIVNKPIEFTQGMLVPGSEKGPGGMYHGEAGLQQFDPLTGKRTDFRKEMLRDSIQSY
jgi:hypothetical protein